MATVKNLAEVSIEEQRNFISSFDKVLLDMDGVIWLFFKPIPGATDCIDNLKKIGKDVRYVTNNTLTLEEKLLGLLNQNNFNVNADEVATPTHVLMDYLKEINMKGNIYLIGNSIIKNELKKHGFSLVPNPPFEIEETLLGILSHYDEETKVGVVIIDIDFNINFIKLQKAFWYLRNNPDCKFMVTFTDKSGPIGPKGPIIGPYHFVNNIVEMSGKDFILLGKPSKLMVNYCLKKFHITEPERVLFIGDSIQSDLATAAEGGFKKLLVLSGTDTIEDLVNWNYPEEFKPDYYVESLGVLNDIIVNTLLKQKL